MHPRLPADWNAITTDWVEAAIASRHPQARLREVRTLWRDDGTNRRLRLGLSYASGEGPQTLFLKSNEPSHREVHLRNGNLFNEARLFAGGAMLPLEHPRVYEAIVDREGGNFLLVMEDLTARGAEPRDAGRPLDLAQASNGLLGLARLHSHYWGCSATTHPQLSWVQTWAATEGWQTGLRRRVPLGLQRAAELLPPTIRALDGDAIVDLWARYVDTLASDAMTLLHGDAHIGNTYMLPEGTVGFLDWQVLRRGNWSQDAGYFLVGALVEEDRRNGERELIDGYRRALAVPEDDRPTAEQAWLRYRGTPAYGLAIWLSTLGTDGWQDPAISRALVRRYATAFVELDTPAALDAIAGPRF